MRNKLFGLISIFLLSIYIFSYVMFRQNYTVIEEMEGGSSYVMFPNKLFLAYSPLIVIDKISGPTRVNIKGW